MYYQCFVYELISSLRQRILYLNPLAFFILVVTLFPLGISPEEQRLVEIAPGIIWIAAILSTLLALQPLFRADLERGFLDKLLLSPQQLTHFILAKITAHWCVTGLPLILLSPLLGILLGLNVDENLVLVISLLLGTPVLSLIGAIGVSLTMTIKNNAAILPLLVLPLFIPILIFGTSAVMAVHLHFSCTGQLKLLTGLFILAVVFAPQVTKVALRMEEFA